MVGVSDLGHIQAPGLVANADAPTSGESRRHGRVLFTFTPVRVPATSLSPDVSDGVFPRLLKHRGPLATPTCTSVPVRDSVEVFLSSSVAESRRVCINGFISTGAQPSDSGDRCVCRTLTPSQAQWRGN